MSKKRLLQINSVINTGSTGRIAEEIGVKAIENGWESYIAYGKKDRPSNSKKIRIGDDWDIKWHGVQTRLFDNHGFASKKATYNFIKEIEKIKPSIVHLHNLHGYYLNIEILFKYLAKANIPVVWTLHDCWTFTGHCTHFSFVKCDKWKTLCSKCPQKKEYPASYLIDRSSKNYVLKKKLFTSIKNITLVPVSEWLANILSESFLSNLPRQIIYNGIDINSFSPSINNSEILEKYNIANRHILLGVAGVWSARKGLFDFYELSKNLTENEVIVLVGLSKQQIRNLPKNIIGIERTENIKELTSLYSAAALFINPTWEDTFPTTNLEAMACGTPVVTYRTGGSPESITTETGFVVKQGNLTGIMNAITEIKLKGKSAYSHACRQRALDLFSKDERYNEYINLYKNIIQ